MVPSYMHSNKTLMNFIISLKIFFLLIECPNQINSCATFLKDVIEVLTIGIINFMHFCIEFRKVFIVLEKDNKTYSYQYNSWWSNIGYDNDFEEQAKYSLYNAIYTMITLVFSNILIVDCSFKNLAHSFRVKPLKLSTEYFIDVAFCKNSCFFRHCSL